MTTENDTQEVLGKILTLTEALLNGDFSQRIITNTDDITISKICNNLNSHADNLQLSTSISGSKEGSTQSINNFIDIISSFSNRDFSKQLPISDNNNIFDAIASGINMLGEELEHTTVSKDELEHERDQLKIAKEAAENANKAKTVFIGNLSHEIRTPLQGIMGFAEILRNEPSAEKRNKYLDIIERRSGDLMEIIEDLLDLATLESGEVKAFPESIDLHKTMEELFHDFRAEHGAKNEHVNMLISNALPKGEIIMLDPLHLRQVILNLLSNGLKFTKEGSITLIAERNTIHYLVKIKDTGIGIENEQLRNIFEPFRQAHEGFSRAKGGIGLGLAICKKRVEIWGGIIQVESEVGKGSTFSFTIPIK
jgi:two-component system, sensor histidine kinase and response regulator